jgi:transcriptional regulator with XRE-family HTH domain
MVAGRFEAAAQIGATVKQLRIGKALTPEELADGAGVRRHQVYRLERGRHLPGLLLLGRLARALDVPLVRLLEPPVRPGLLERLRASRIECEKLLTLTKELP